MRQRIVVANIKTAASATAISAAATVGAGGSLVLTSSPFTMPDNFQRRVSLTSAANISAGNFIVTGTKSDGISFSETLAGPNANTVQTKSDFLTVTSIVSVASTGANTVSAGTGTTAGSAWIPLDHWARPQTDLTCVITGSPTYTVEVTDDNLLANAPPYNTFSSSDTNVVNATTNQRSFFTTKPAGVRVTIVSGTAPVSVTLTVLEGGF